MSSYTKEQLIELLTQFEERHDKLPTRREMRSEFGVTEDPFMRVFGSWKAAKEEYLGGKSVSNEKGWSTSLVIPDAHVGPGQDLTRFKKLAGLIQERRPDRIIFMGDFVTLESLSNWDLTKAGVMEGRRYHEDVASGKEALELALAPLKEASGYKPQVVYLMGNHECVGFGTEILTKDGWVLAEEVTEEHEVASFDQDHQITFSKPEALSTKVAPLVEVTGHNNREVVSRSHKVYVDNALVPVESLLGERIKQTRFTHAGKRESKKVDLSLDWLRLLTWAVMDATIRTEPGQRKCRIQFKLSKPRKIEALKELLDRMELPYTFRLCKKTGLNKLQPYYIRIYSDTAREIHAKLNHQKVIPEWFTELDHEQAMAVLEVLEQTDGHRTYNHITMTTVDQVTADRLQLMCIYNGVSCKYKKGDGTKSGFANAKPQYFLSIFDRGLFDINYVEVKDTGTEGPVVAIQTKDGTLITRREGIVAFTGNSRLDRYLETKPELKEHLGLRKDMALAELGVTDVVEYRDNFEVEGTLFTHIPQNAANQPVTGKYAIHRAAEQTAKSVVCGHSHRRESVNYYRHGADTITQVSMVGAFFEHVDSYAYGGLNAYWRGLAILTHWAPGRYDVEEIALERLLQMY